MSSENVSLPISTALFPSVLAVSGTPGPSDIPSPPCCVKNIFKYAVSPSWNALCPVNSLNEGSHTHPLGPGHSQNDHCSLPKPVSAHVCQHMYVSTCMSARVCACPIQLQCKRLHANCCRWLIMDPKATMLVRSIPIPPPRVSIFTNVGAVLQLCYTSVLSLYFLYSSPAVLQSCYTPVPSALLQFPKPWKNAVCPEPPHLKQCALVFKHSLPNHFLPAVSREACACARSCLLRDLWGESSSSLAPV